MKLHLYCSYNPWTESNWTKKQPFIQDLINIFTAHSQNSSSRDFVRDLTLTPSYRGHNSRCNMRAQPATKNVSILVTNSTTPQQTNEKETSKTKTTQCKFCSGPSVRWRSVRWPHRCYVPWEDQASCRTVFHNGWIFSIFKNKANGSSTVLMHGNCPFKGPVEHNSFN